MTKIFKGEFIPIPTLQNHITEACTDGEKAEMLAVHFEGIHKANIENNKEQEAIERETIVKMNRVKTDNEKINKITYQDLLQIIKKLPNKKAPGNDSIQNIIIKQLPKKVMV